MKRLVMLLAVSILLCAGPAWAACSWSGNTGTVASPYAVTDVAACVSDASSKTGAVIIQIPNSSVTWGGTLTVNMSSGFANVTSLTIRGQNDCTLATQTGMPTGMDFQYPTSCPTGITTMALALTTLEGKAFRFAHLQLNGGSTVTHIGNGKSWRFDHLFWNNVSSPHIFYFSDNFPSLSPYFEGLIDHNNVLFTIGGNGAGFIFHDIHANAEWIAPFGLGTSAAVYAEQNRIIWPEGTGDGIFNDNNGGARLVIRGNYMLRGRIAGHTDGGFSSSMRGGRKAEAYGNWIENSCRSSYMQSNGVFFNNAVRETGCSHHIGLTVRRRSETQTCTSSSGNDYLNSLTTYPTGGGCTLGVNGCVKLDGNGPPDGYPCRDQTGADQAADGSMTAGAKPFLIWGNYVLSGDILGAFTLNVSTDGTYLTDGVDYFSQSSATGSPQTGGVRTGTKTTLNTLGCSKGFFWVTDEGYWNSTTPGTPSGVLYKCTATNTWTPHYLPYPFPHPLQSGLAAPTGLTVK